MATKRYTIRQVLTLLLGLALAPLATGAVLVLALQWRAERHAVDERLAEQALTLAQAVERELATAQSRLQALAASELLATADWPAFHAFARRAVGDWPGALVAVTDDTGQLQVNTAVPLGTPLPNVWALEAQRAVTQWEGRTLPLGSQGLTRRVFDTGRPQFSDLYYGVSIRRPTLALAIPAPQDDGRQLALTLSFPPSSLQQLLDQARREPGLRAAVVDRNGLVVASNGTSARLGERITPLPSDAQRDGRYEFTTRDGVPIVGAYAVSLTNGFTVRVSMPRAQAYAAAERSALIWTLLVLSVLLAGAGAVGWLARRVTADLKSLAQMAAVDAPPEAEARHSPLLEIATVAQALARAQAQAARHREEALQRRLAEEQRASAAASEQHLRRLVDNLFAFVGVLDLDGRVLEVNRAPLELAGLRREDVIGQLFWECRWWGHDPAVRAACRDSVRRAAAGETVRRDVPLRMAGDTLITIDFQLAPLRDENGAVTHLVPSGVDITERVRAADALRESESRFRALADNIPQLAWIGDAQGDLHWYNRRWFEFTGTTLEQVRGWGWERVHHPAHLERVRAKFRSHLASGQAWEDTFPLRRHDGSWRWFLSRAVPIRDDTGLVTRWFGTNTDVTDQLQTEQALRASQEQLRRADRQKDEFLATLSHELRNPLAPIRTCAEIIRMREPADPVVARAGATIQRQAAHLTRLVDDLLDMSRITLGTVRLELAAVDLRTLVSAAVEVARPAIDAAGQRLTVSMPAQPLLLQADAVRLSQVLANLLHNAAKFTPPGGDIALTLAAEDGWAVLALRDSGRGVAPDMLERIFELFVQEHRSGHEGNSGLGIGLALTRRLLQMHGGTIHARSDGAGQGSEFVVRLPLDPTPAPAAAPAGPAALPAPRPDACPALRLLVVDDNVDAARSLGELLELQGHRVALAHDAASALQRVRDERPQAVLLDLGLPDLDGCEVARRLRAGTPAGSPPLLLVALTGWGQQQDRQRALEAGCDHHLTKPADPARLSQLLAEHFAGPPPPQAEPAATADADPAPRTDQTAP